MAAAPIFVFAAFSGSAPYCLDEAMLDASSSSKEAHSSRSGRTERATSMRQLLSLLLALAIAAPAVAEDASRFSLGGGLTLPLAAFGDVDGTGFHFHGGVNFPLGSGAFAARLDGLLSRTGHDGVPGHTRMVGGMVGLVYRAPTQGSVKPYVRAAIGLTNVKTSQLIGIGFDTFPYSYSETKPSFGGGVGITIALGPMNLFVEGRVIVVNTAGQSTTFAPLTIGMAFGGK